MKITSAKYKYNVNNRRVIEADIDGTILIIPEVTDNRHYAEIMKQVDAGELTIEPAEE